MLLLLLWRRVLFSDEDEGPERDAGDRIKAREEPRHIAAPDGPAREHNARWRGPGEPCRVARVVLVSLKRGVTGAGLNTHAKEGGRMLPGEAKRGTWTRGIW